MAYKPPSPLGYPEAIQSAGGIAAPLLAGFCFTMVTSLAWAPQEGEGALNCWWSEYALVCLVGAGLCLIYSVQASIWARSWQTTPDEIQAWYGSHPEKARESLQGEHVTENRKWCLATARWYHAGILLFLMGVGLSLMPTASVSTARAVALLVAGAGFAGEIVWIVSTLLPRK